MPCLPEVFPDSQGRVPCERQSPNEFEAQSGTFPKSDLCAIEENVATAFERELHAVVDWASLRTLENEHGTIPKLHATIPELQATIASSVQTSMLEVFPGTTCALCQRVGQVGSRPVMIVLAGIVIVTCVATLVRWSVFYHGVGIFTPCADVSFWYTYQFLTIVTLGMNFVATPIVAWVLLQASTPDVVQAGLYLMHLNFHVVVSVVHRIDQCSGDVTHLGNLAGLIVPIMFFFMSVQYAHICVSRLAALHKSAMIQTISAKASRWMSIFLLVLVTVTYLCLAYLGPGMVVTSLGVLSLLLVSLWMSFIMNGYYGIIPILKPGIWLPHGRQQLEVVRALRVLRFQTVGVAFSFATTLLVGIIGFAFFSMSTDAYSRHVWFQWLRVITYTLHYAAHYFSALWFSGALFGALGGGRRTRKDEFARKRRWRESSWEWQPCLNEDWHSKVHELAHRGFSLGALIKFYRDDLREAMPDFLPSKHTTKDVVRRAIIPLSKDACTAYATVMMGGQHIKPMKMVTHNWGNLFCDLVAAIVSDALEEDEFDKISDLLNMDIAKIERWIDHKGVAWNTYWVCAFSVSQHDGICSSNPFGEADTVSGCLYPMCDCSKPKYFNTSIPTYDDKSIPCEMNKFDDMMAYLSAHNKSFAQVIVVDRKFEIFSRAWCMAELAKANTMGMRQHLKVVNAEALDEVSESLRGLRVQHMQASRTEDVILILAAIPDKERFNRDLQKLIFDSLIADWQNLDASAQMVLVGRAARWLLASSALRRLSMFRSSVV